MGHPVSWDKEEQIKAEVYLGARGWAELPASAAHEGAEPEERWFRVGERAAKRYSLKGAVSRQLRNDVVAFVYMLDNLDAERRPGTRKIVGGLLMMILTDVWQEFWHDEKARLGMAESVVEKLKEAIPKLFEDRDFRQAVEAVRMLWHMHGKVVEKRESGGDDEKPN